MIPKKNKLFVSEVRRVFSSPDKVTFSNLFKTQAVFDSDKPKFAVVIPRSVTKKSVERNRLRRQVYSLLSKVYKKQKPGLYVVVVNKKILTSSVDEIKKDLEKIFKL